MNFARDATPIHAWYSAQQEASIGRCLWYVTDDGSKVETTMVTTNPEHGCQFNDMEYRGMVSRYSGVCRRDRARR